MRSQAPWSRRETVSPPQTCGHAQDRVGCPISQQRRGAAAALRNLDSLIKYNVIYYINFKFNI